MNVFRLNHDLPPRPSRALSACIAAMVIALLSPAVSVISATSSSIALPKHTQDAEMILANMLEAQENLADFDLPATARVYVGGRKVLSAGIQVSASRPNHVAIRWLGVTIRPRKGLIFIDPEQFVSGDYALSVMACPERSSGPGSDDSPANNRWIVSAVSVPGSASRLRWTLYVDPDTWLIVRAEVITSNSETCIIEASYRNAGYHRWEPLTVRAEGRIVLQEFLPDFLVGLILGPVTDEIPAYVDLDFSQERSIERRSRLISHDAFCELLGPRRKSGEELRGGGQGLPRGRAELVSEPGQLLVT